MNLTISPIKFNNLASISRQKENRNNNLYGEIKLADLASSLALKNQILFKGISPITQRENLIQSTIDKNSLPIKPQTLDFVLSAPIEKAFHFFIPICFNGIETIEPSGKF